MRMICYGVCGSAIRRVKKNTKPTLKKTKDWCSLYPTNWLLTSRNDHDPMHTHTLFLSLINIQI